MRRGQFVFLKWLIFIGFVFILWAVGFSGTIGEMTSAAISGGNLNGTESFLVANMNLWVFFIIILAAFAAVYFGRSDA
jgi:hypothetical protein